MAGFRAPGRAVERPSDQGEEPDRPGRILLAFADRLEAPVGVLLANLDAQEGSRGFAVVEAVVDAVENAAAGRPVVVVAEDLHWADELSLRGIATLGDWTRYPSPWPSRSGRHLDLRSSTGCWRRSTGETDGTCG